MKNKNYINKAIFILGLLIPALFVYRSLFVHSSLSFGDAPHYYKEAMDYFLKIPGAWQVLGSGLGGINMFIWISPLMYIYSVLGRVFSATNDTIVRILFYFPAILFSFITPIVFTKYFKFSRVVQFFSALIYGLNTYTILLVDGGQVGVLLAYSIFPYVLLHLFIYVQRPKAVEFFTSLLFVLILTIIDPRIAAICFLTAIIWRPRKILHLAGLVIFLLPLCLYWLLPLVRIGTNNLSLEVLSTGFLSLINPLLLYQPHWFANIYGQITYPPFYFILIPLFIFFGFLLKKDKNANLVKTFGILFLVFAFLTKGENAPLGFMYKFMIEKVPFGFAFRDSSKFFIPTLLFAGVLIGNTVEKLNKKAIVIASYFLLLLLLTPALLGKFNFVLSKNYIGPDYFTIYNQINRNPGDYKTLWFSEKPTPGFENEKIPAINAKSLIELRPIASLNGGSSDLFNFFNQDFSVDWIKILGVKYMFFPGDTRKFDFSKEEMDSWQKLLQNVSNYSSFKKLDWSTDIPVYEVVDYMPKTFDVDKMFLVVGGESVYQNRGINPLLNGVVFAEDGVLDMDYLSQLPSGSFELIYEEKDTQDLKFSFLTDYFLGQSDLKRNDWAKYSSDEYLLWKYQLLIRGIQTKEFDFKKGILLSTQKDEEVDYEININNDGVYIFGVRGMSYEDNLLSLTFGNRKDQFAQKQGSFGWKYIEADLKKGKQKISLVNKDGIQVINTIAVVPIDKWQESEEKTVEFEKKFYSGDNTNYPKWSVYSQNYHSLWRMKCSNNEIPPVPVYSALNAFITDDCVETDDIYFKGQRYVDIGVWVSAVSLAVYTLVFVVIKFKSR